MKTGTIKKIHVLDSEMDDEGYEIEFEYELVGIYIGNDFYRVIHNHHHYSDTFPKSWIL